MASMSSSTVGNPPYPDWRRRCWVQIGRLEPGQRPAARPAQPEMSMSTGRFRPLMTEHPSFAANVSALVRVNLGSRAKAFPARTILLRRRLFSSTRGLRQLFDMVMARKACEGPLSFIRPRTSRDRVSFALSFLPDMARASWPWPRCREAFAALRRPSPSRATGLNRQASCTTPVRWQQAVRFQARNFRGPMLALAAAVLPIMRSLAKIAIYSGRCHTASIPHPLGFVARFSKHTIDEGVESRPSPLYLGRSNRPKPPARRPNSACKPRACDTQVTTRQHVSTTQVAGALRPSCVKSAVSMLGSRDALHYCAPHPPHFDRPFDCALPGSRSAGCESTLKKGSQVSPPHRLQRLD